MPSSAVMCADVVLYSRLMGIDEEGTEYRGRTLRAVGDALPVEFNSVADAVRKRNARADGRDYVIERRAADHSANIGFRKHRFATDSPVEGSGFEPWVPPRKRRPWREVPRPTIVVSRDDLSLMTLQVIGPGSPFGNSRETFRKSGTDGSNPLPSSEESQQQTRFRHLRHGGYRARLKMPAGRAPRLSLELQ